MLIFFYLIECASPVLLVLVVRSSVCIDVVYVTVLNKSPLQSGRDTDSGRGMGTGGMLRLERNTNNCLPLTVYVTEHNLNLLTGQPPHNHIKQDSCCLFK